MRIFGFGVWTIVLLLVVFILGAKNPQWLARIPLLNRI